MAGIAAAAAVLAALATLEHGATRRDECRRRAAEHARAEASFRALSAIHRPAREVHRPGESGRFEAYERRAEYHAEMRRKWERAAGRPWSHVDPDPPEPQ